MFEPHQRKIVFKVLAPEQEDDGPAVDEDAGEHEDEDEDVGGAPVEGEAVHHHLHPGFGIHFGF